MRQKVAGRTLAVSLNGFWLYLGALDVIGRAPRTSTTAAWYAMLGLASLAGAWLNRGTLVARLRRLSRPTTWFVGGSSVLVLWFLANVVLVSHTSSLARTFAALLVLWSAPTAVLALSLPRPALDHAAVGIVVLGLAYAVIEWTAFVHGHSTEERFSPIAGLDPITAAQFPALAAVALLAAGGAWRFAAARPFALGVLVAATVVPGSRGPILALAAAVLAVVLLQPRRSWLVTVPTVAVGLALGFAAASHVGSGEYLSSAIPGGSGLGHSSTPGAPAAQPIPISTLRIRREWWASAAKAIPDRPLFGHGVAMFVDDTPEARRMGIAGERTYPHNSPLESLYSLGLLGAIPYAIFILSALVALVGLARRGLRAPGVMLGVGIWVFAFASSNVSGEIGADAVVWAAGALAVGLYADTAPSR